MCVARVFPRFFFFACMALHRGYSALYWCQVARWCGSVPLHTSLRLHVCNSSSMPLRLPLCDRASTDPCRQEEEEKAQRDLEEAGWTAGTGSSTAAGSNPAAYLVTADEPVTAPPAGGGLPDQTAAGVSGQPVTATTAP